MLRIYSLSVWKEKEKSRVRAVQMDSPKRLLGITRMDRFPNARISELCGVKKGLNEMIVECVLWWFGHVERMERDGIAKRVYVGECAGSCLVDRPRKRWIECLKKIGLDIR